MIDELGDAVVRVGDHLMKWRNSGPIEGSWNGTQLKTQADLKAHSLLVNELSAIDPVIPIMSEEDPDSWKFIEKDRYFVIDPIDGTASYAGGFPGFVTQVALIEKNRPTLAAIYAPAFGQLFTAIFDLGAFLNEKQIHISSPDRWNTLIDNYPEPRGVTAEAFQNLHLTNYIECGSISLKICKVAEGTADIFFKNILVRNWDIAAPHLVIAEAGGVLLDIWGKEYDYSQTTRQAGVVAANSVDHANRLISWYSNNYSTGETP
jgi:3'(2'), 5'-bisphosphate nucleotidase/myo-inositol-1(or 4)-monophosphatase